MRSTFLILILTLSSLAFMPVHVSSDTTDVALKRVAVRTGAIVQRLHNKTRKALLNMSRDSVFKSRFALEKSANKALDRATVGARARAMAKKLEAQSLTLLDAAGNSIVKVVDGEVLDATDAGTLQSPRSWTSSLQGQRKPVASPIYLSSHLDRWVFAHARTVDVGEGKYGFLHAEFDLVSIQNSFSRRKRPEGIDVLAVTEEGWVIFDSRGRISTHRWSSSSDPAAYFDRFEASGMRVQELLARQEAGELNFVGDGSDSEIVVSQADNFYLIAIRNRPFLGAASK